ncbi:MAG: translation initiation factor IF-2, partial [Lachnospiraceae bacterium]|nr:translation initiation factor IF-2 [Lachnospiraceae bacterium]
MAKTRIHAVAKELNVASKDVVNFLVGKGYDVKSHSSTIEDDAIALIRERFGGGASSGTKPMEKAVPVAASADPAHVSEAPVRKPEADANAHAPERKEPPSGAPQKEGSSGPAADREKRPRPPKKKKIAVVFNSQHSKASGGSRTGEGGSRRPASSERRALRNNDPRRGAFRPEGGNRVIRPRPESERTVRPEATKPRPQEEEIIIAKPQPVEEKPKAPVKTEEKPVRITLDMIRGKAPENKETPKNEGSNRPAQEQKQNARPSGGEKKNKFGGNNKSGEGANNAKSGNNEKKNSGGRDAGKNKKRNQEHDALGSKKKERYGNLEKNSAKKKQKGNQPKTEARNEDEILTLILPEHLTIRELADKMKIAPSAIVKKLFMKGKMVTVNQDIDYEQAEEIALEFNCICEPEEKVDVIAELLKEDEEDPDNMVSRPPVVCVMGHVDHGKTSLLDAIRDTRVQAKEAGGITQKIGAYVVTINDQNITFLDTPGHEAFTAMRMRGANSTDIAILVVAADDGVMPQTVEAINHAKAAGIEIIVAINKIDKPNANIERVKQELSEYELIPEDWGGSTVFVPVSAKTQEGIEQLLEMILLTAEVLELRSNPKRNARGLVIEAELDKGRGVVATVLVQKGTLKVGDPVAAGSSFGRVRAMIDDSGKNVKSAGPSVPVEILGLSEVP